jgi:hypothetical protein
MCARFGWLLGAAALALAAACTQRPDVVAKALQQADASKALPGTDAGGVNRNRTGTGGGGPSDAGGKSGLAFVPDAASMCQAIVSSYEALQYVISHNCEIPPFDSFLSPVIAFAKANPMASNRTGETRMPTYCDLVPGSNPVYYEVPDSGTTKLCPVYCDLARMWLQSPQASRSYVDCKNGR